LPPGTTVKFMRAPDAFEQYACLAPEELKLYTEHGWGLLKNGGPGGGGLGDGGEGGGGALGAVSQPEKYHVGAAAQLCAMTRLPLETSGHTPLFAGG
jgi:hypothetical protein